MPTGDIRGGAEQSLLQAVQHRKPSSNWTVVLLERGPIEERLREMDADVVVVDAGRMRELARFVQTVRTLRSLLKSGRFDVAIGWMTKAQLYLALAARRAGIPSVWFHLSTPNRRFWMDRLAARLPTKAIFTVSREAQRAQQAFTRVPVELIYPGADLDRFAADSLPSVHDARAELGMAGDGPVVGIVGRLQRWKGVDVLVRAMPTVIRRFPNATCAVVGGEHPLEPGYLTELTGLTTQLGLDGNVAFAGLRPDPERWMQAMDVVVHASDREPFGIVIVEAMSLGKPVIATDAGGPSEIVTNGVDGLLVPFGDHAALAAAILRVLEDSELAARLGAEARRTASRFGAGEFAENLHAALERYALTART